MDGNVAELLVSARKSLGGVVEGVVELAVPHDGLVGDLAARLAEHEKAELAQIMLVCRGAPLRNASETLRSFVDPQDTSGKLQVVYIVRKAPAVPVAAPAPAPPAPAEVPTASASASAGLGVAPNPAVAAAAAGRSTGEGRRVLLLVRHGQCCHEGEVDNMKALTQHGHLQAESTAKHIAQLVLSGDVPSQRALLHSTSRRARETAAKLPGLLPGLEVWNADLLRETDPTENPLRAEEVFGRLFVAPPHGSDDTLIVVAHNNIILYLLMRVADIPIERAAQAWHLFTLRHASVTRIEIASSGARRIVAVGAAGHIPDGIMTWNNITGEDMSAWKGGGPERKKFGGRMLILIRQTSGDNPDAAEEAVVQHVGKLSGFMVSSKAKVACCGKGRALPLASALAKQLRVKVQVMPDSVEDQPEGAFHQFFGPSEGGERTRDTVVLVAEDRPLLYLLLRSLHFDAKDARTGIGAYQIGPGSITLINARSDGSMKVVGIGDMGHLSPPS